MTPDDRVVSTLAEIRERGYRNGATGALCARLSDAADVDVPRLLAAVEAALELADELERIGTAPSSKGTDGPAGEGLRWCAVKIREAITTALTGTETPGDH